MNANYVEIPMILLSESLEFSYTVAIHSVLLALSNFLCKSLDNVEKIE